MMANTIQKLMIDKGIRKGDFAERCGWTTSNLYNKMKRDNFSESELYTMAEALGYDLKIEFIPKSNNNSPEN